MTKLRTSIFVVVWLEIVVTLYFFILAIMIFVWMDRLSDGDQFDAYICVRLILRQYGELLVFVVYSLHPKMIVLLPRFFCPKMIVWFIYLIRNLRLKVIYFHTKLSISRNLSTPQLPRIVVIFYLKSHTHNYQVRSLGLNFTKVRKTDKGNKCWAFRYVVKARSCSLDLLGHPDITYLFIPRSVSAQSHQ